MAASPSRMGLPMGPFEFLYRVMGIHLRGRKVRMAQQFLHGIQVSAMFEQVGGEGVAQDVGASFFLGGHRTKVTCNEGLYGTPRQGFTVGPHQECRSKCRCKLLPHFQVIAK